MNQDMTHKFSTRGFAALFTAAALTGLAAFAGPAAADAGFKPEIKYAEVNGVKLAYYTRGQGKPLLMINGFLSSMSLWDPALLADLETSHTLVLFDNRGVGLSSDTAENNTTIPQMADDAAALIGALQLDHPDVLAWSMGARIGQQLAIRHPEVLNKLVLVSADPGGTHNDPATRQVETALNDPDVDKMKKLYLTYPDNDAGRQAAKDTMARLEAAVKDGSIPDDFAVSKETTLRQTRARTTLWEGNDANYDALKTITTPVLVTAGMDDIIDPPKNAAIIADQVPFAWTAYFTGGHAFLFQSHARFSAAVDMFLADQGN
jgi:pimeloyl-ACP methyl ester carboxylesterase